MKKTFSFKADFWILLIVISILPLFVYAGDVLVVCGSDSSAWRGVSYYRQYQYFQEEDPVFISDSGNMAICMSDSYRDELRDSAGNPIKFTWWAHCGSLYNYSLTSSGIVSLELTLDYHGDNIVRWGDEVSFHYHTWEWTDPNHDGVYHWNQAPNFLTTKDDFDSTLANILIERSVWPATFRTGWNTMDNDWNKYLDTIIPYRMENWYPHVGYSDVEPIGSVYDWDHAVTDWIPYHPSSTDYQVPGDCRGWETRCEYVPDISQGMVNGIFAAAQAGPDQIIVAWSHIAESSYPNQMRHLHNRIVTAHNLHPEVNFYYHTGIGAMQRWRGTTDTKPPELNIVLEKKGDLRTLFLHSDETLFQAKPFTAIKRINGEYDILDAVRTSEKGWQVSYNRLLEPISKIGFGITDLAGNPASYVLQMDTSASDTLPAIQITQPNFGLYKADKAFPITWRDEDPSGKAKISLYYDRDEKGYDGALIAQDIPAYEPFSDVFIWDASLVAEGSWYVYGLVDDGINAPVGSYSQVPVEISHGLDMLPPEPVTDLSAEETSPGEVELNWSLPPASADGDLPVYFLIYGSPSSPVDPSPGNLSGLAPLPSLSYHDIPMVAGDFYYVLVSVDDAGNSSTLSNIAHVDVTENDILPPLPVDDLTCDDSSYPFIVLSWTTPGKALDGDVPVRYEIYRSTSSPVDYDNEENRVGDMRASALNKWRDYNTPLYQAHYYIVIGIDDAGHRSLPSNQVEGARISLDHELKQLWRVDEGPFTKNSIRRIIYNKWTGHLMISDVDEDVIHIVEASDGTDTGRDLIEPETGWVDFGPYGLTIDDTGVIYGNQFWGNGNLYRWQDEESTPTLAADSGEIPDDTRGIFATGGGAGTKIFSVVDDTKVNILTTVDGMTYTHSGEIDTGGISARHGIWSNKTGTELLCTDLLTGPAGIQRWRLVDSSWEKDPGFSPTIGGVDGIWQSPGDLIFTAHSEDNSVTILDASTGATVGRSDDLGTGELSMDIFADDDKGLVYWCRDGLGYGCLQYTYTKTIRKQNFWCLY